MKKILLATFVIAVFMPMAVSAGRIDFEPPAVDVPDDATPAPAGFGGHTNGIVDQATHDDDREVFTEAEEIEDGLGPVYNSVSCGECHGSPIAGAASQINELRVVARDYRRILGTHTGRNWANQEMLSRSLVNDRTICPSSEFPEVTALIQAPRGAIPAPRMSLNLLGDGFVEAVEDSLLRNIAAQQCSRDDGICGEVIEVPLLEADGSTRVGRFGWKNQHASLLSFSADAYLNEMGITSPLLPEEVTDVCDTVPDPEDDGEDIEIFARFMRALEAPARDLELAAAPEAQRGEAIFQQIGCSNCHLPTLVTAPAGTVLNGGDYTVPEALGNKTFHPYGDFLLHDVGTGDGVVQNGPRSTADKLRTAPLWGLRFRTRLMHDGNSITIPNAIRRHRREANPVVGKYRYLSPRDRKDLLAFLNSL